jgi:hypothetical protein
MRVRIRRFTKLDEDKNSVRLSSSGPGIARRVTAEEEEAGLDLSQHGESAYPDTGLAALKLAEGKRVTAPGELAVNWMVSQGNPAGTGLFRQE